MSFEMEAREYTLKQLYEKCKFTFHESELSPSIRKKIGLFSESLQDIWRYKNEVSQMEKDLRSKRDILFGLGLMGILAILLIGSSPFFSIIGVFFIFMTVLYYKNSYSPMEKKYAGMKQNLYERIRLWDYNIELLSKEITDELTLVYQQKVKPTVTEIKIDYASILKLAQEKDKLKYLRCPNCGAPITPSSTEKAVVCKYCNMTIQTQSIIDELKKILYSSE
jgi:DNA-directed RNA polymerase subunit RPC12/RpoP